MADTLAIRWPRSPGDPARCAVVRGSSAIGAVAATDGPPTAESLRAAVAAMKFGGKRCVVALPRSLATTRRLALPDVPDDDLPDLVRMQAATRSAAPLDQLALDFLPLPPGSADPSGGGEAAPGRAALSASVPAATVKAVREAVAGAGLELATVGLTAGGLANLVVARGGGGFGNTLVAARDGDRAELVVVAAGPAGPAVVLTHASHPHGDDDAQWNRALLADAARVLLSQSDAVPGGVTRAWAVGDGAADMAELLAGRFGCETTAAADWPALGLAGDAAGEFGPGPLGGAVGLAAPAALPALDFLSPRRRPEPEDRRLRNGLLAATAATVLVGGGWWYLDGQKRDLNDQIVVLNAEIDASQELLDLNAPLLEEDAAVAAWAAGVPAPRTELVRLDGFLPPTDTLYLTEFRLDPPAGGDRPVLKATGNAASAAVVRDLERTLDGAGYVLAPTDLKDRRVDPACPIRFVLTAEVPERTAEAAAGDAPPDGGGGPGDVRENRERGAAA